MDQILPAHPGLLPKWLLLVSIVSALNSVQAYSTLSYTKRVYSAAPEQVTGLSGRTFGTWTFLSSVIRLYAAYDISNPTLYQLAFATYAVAFVHFVGEWRLFKTAAWGSGLAAPIFVATGTLTWMLLQRNFYVA
ncbi:MAG: ergosterol biosynthesis protein [Lichina confinis]|nr:MAG: ergosterol biosynthesis protein [Lichina confinis]